MPKVVATRTEKRKAATEREKRRMERVNEQLESLKSIVAPDVKTMTKSKILDAVLERILYLESITGDSIQVPANHGDVQTQMPSETTQSSPDCSLPPVSPGSSDQSLDSGCFPDYNQIETQYVDTFAQNLQDHDIYPGYNTTGLVTTTPNQYYHPYALY